MSNGSSGRPSAARDQPPEVRHLGRGEHGDEEILDLPLGDLAVALEAAGDEGRLVGAVGIDLAHGVEDLEQGGVAGVGLARCESSHLRRRPPSVRTSLVSGSQSRSGLSITAAGISWRTMRSITLRISRCFASPAGLASA